MRGIWSSLEGPSKKLTWEHLSGSLGRVALSPSFMSASLALGVLFFVPCWNSLKTRLCFLYLQISLSAVPASLLVQYQNG